MGIDWMTRGELPQAIPALLEQFPMTDSDPISEEWLDYICARRGSLYYTMLLEPTNPEAAIVEMTFLPDESGWLISLVQGVPDDSSAPDDHVVLTSLPDNPTIGRIRDLCRALGKELPK